MARRLMVHFQVNHHIGELIGYMTLAVLCLMVILRAPNFVKYRLRAISRPSSFRSRGYFLSQGDNTQTEKPAIQNILKDESGSHFLVNSTAKRLTLRAKRKFIVLTGLQIRSSRAFMGGLNFRQLLLILTYMIVLVILGLYKNTYDGITISKYRRFGYIAIAQFPLLFVLGMKNSPLSIVTGLGYEKLNFFHRFIGRMIFVFALIHAALQIRLQHEITGSIRFRNDALYGLIALCTLAAMNLLGFRFLRNSFYQIFLVTHIIGYLTLIITLWKHTDSAHPYLGACIAFLAFDNCLKILKSRVKRATFIAMPAGLTRIEVQGINNGWRAGQHIFIRVLKGRQIFEKHPFTIANAPNSSTPYGSIAYLLLVAKAAGDFTHRIHRLAGQPHRNSASPGAENSLSPLANGGDPQSTVEIQLGDANMRLSSGVSHYVLVDGPYGTFFTDMTRYRTVLLFAGGSGFTFCMATLEDIIGEAAKSGASVTKHIFVVWSMRDPGMLQCFLPDIMETIRVSENCDIGVTIKIFITKGGKATQVEPSVVNRSIEFNYARPDLPQIIHDVINEKALMTGGGVGVGACGPLALLEYDSEDIPFGTPWWFLYAGISCLLVLFAGIMSGLTLGLMSLGLVDLEILRRSGSSTEKKQAAAIFPVVQKQHQLLVTLLLCNACAMEALPIYLDKIFHPFVAVLLSVTFVLSFGEVIPQAICTRYGLYVGANFVGLVRVLMIICYPIAYPIGKVLDVLLGHNHALFRRAQLKALVSIHSQEAGKGGELTHDEATIISGALDLTEKTAEEAMTPIESTFSLDVASKLDWEAIGKILSRGHSRVPVYSGNPKNIIGLLLVKNLLTIRAETETPVSAVSIRRIPRVPGDMPLYDILNEFQKGSSHMAAVVKVTRETKYPLATGNIDKSKDKEVMKHSSQLSMPLLARFCEKSEKVVNIDKLSNHATDQQFQKDVTATNGAHHSLDNVDDGEEVIGIITLEDVFEELLQEEIVDETDVYIDVHRRIRVAAVAAATSVARVPSGRKLTGHKPAVTQNQGN